MTNMKFLTSHQSIFKSVQAKHRTTIVLNCRQERLHTNDTEDTDERSM